MRIIFLHAFNVLIFLAALIEINAQSNVCSTKTPCKNGGTCINQPGLNLYGYTCLCHSQWTGYNCERSTTDKSIITGGSGGVGGGGGSFGGQGNNPGGFPNIDNARRNPCQSFPCRNGASCYPSMDNSKYSCKCAPKWTGPYCEQPLNSGGGINIGGPGGGPGSINIGGGGGGGSININNKYGGMCTLSTCLNNGQCVAMQNDFTCRCMSGFAGKRCELRSSKSSSGGFGKMIGTIIMIVIVIGIIALIVCCCCCCCCCFRRKNQGQGFKQDFNLKSFMPMTKKAANKLCDRPRRSR